MFILKYPVKSEDKDMLYIDCSPKEWEDNIQGEFKEYTCSNCNSHKFAETPFIFKESGEPGVLYNLCCTPQYRGVLIVMNGKDFSEMFKNVHKGLHNGK